MTHTQTHRAPSIIEHQTPNTCQLSDQMESWAWFDAYTSRCLAANLVLFGCSMMLVIFSLHLFTYLFVPCWNFLWVGSHYAVLVLFYWRWLRLNVIACAFACARTTSIPCIVRIHTYRSVWTACIVCQNQCHIMSYIFLVIMLVLVIYLISFISPRFCSCALCMRIQVYLIKLLFRLLLFVGSVRRFLLLPFL